MSRGWLVDGSLWKAMKHQTIQVAVSMKESIFKIPRYDCIAFIFVFLSELSLLLSKLFFIRACACGDEARWEVLGANTVRLDRVPSPENPCSPL